MTLNESLRLLHKLQAAGYMKEPPFLSKLYYLCNFEDESSESAKSQGFPETCELFIFDFFFFVIIVFQDRVSLFSFGV